MPSGGFKQITITRGIGKEIDLHYTPYQSCDVIFGGKEGGSFDPPKIVGGFSSFLS